MKSSRQTKAMDTDPAHTHLPTLFTCWKYFFLIQLHALCTPASVLMYCEYSSVSPTHTHTHNSEPGNFHVHAFSYKFISCGHTSIQYMVLFISVVPPVWPACQQYQQHLRKSSTYKSQTPLQM